MYYIVSNVLKAKGDKLDNIGEPDELDNVDEPCVKYSILCVLDGEVTNVLDKTK